MDAFQHFDLGGVRDFGDRFLRHDAIGRSAHRPFPEGEDPHARIFQVEGAFIVRPAGVPPELNAVGTADWVAEPFAILHPHARFAGCLAIRPADLQGRDQAEFQTQAVLLGKLADPGNLLDIGVHVGHQTAGMILARPILLEEMVERDHERSRALVLGCLADLTKTGDMLLTRHEAKIDRLFGIGSQRFEFRIADQNDPGLGNAERPRAGIAGHFPAIDILGDARLLGGGTCCRGQYPHKNRDPVPKGDILPPIFVNQTCHGKSFQLTADA